MVTVSAAPSSGFPLLQSKRGITNSQVAVTAKDPLEEMSSRDFGMWRALFDEVKRQVKEHPEEGFVPDVEAIGQYKYTKEEVNAMLAQVLENKRRNPWFYMKPA
ncbi:hypothetical protein BC835DRAFT_1396260 [Cytidiella melzeri]|nr:hypothetical protein BC835DRAFT_1396260 [Cytidiella melzeri]